MRQWHAHTRLLISLAAGAAAFALMPAQWSIQTRLIAGYDAGAGLFLVLAWPVMWWATTAHMQERARIEDQGRWAVLVLAVMAAAASLFAIGFELHQAKGVSGAGAALPVALAVATILLSWLFVHTVFALHYAHEYFGEAKSGGHYDMRGGLEFPGEKKPDYWDFLYFAAVIAATCQVSDVEVTGRTMRRLVLAHGVFAFLFNTMILAFAINIAAGLI